MIPVPLIVAVTTVVTGVAVHHAVTGHHRHLALLRIFRPSVVVPQTAHDAWFHRLSWPRKIAANAAIITASIMTGTAWMLSPLVTAFACITLVLSILGARAVRSTARRGRKT